MRGRVDVIIGGSDGFIGGSGGFRLSAGYVGGIFDAVSSGSPVDACSCAIVPIEYIGGGAGNAE